MDLLRKIFMIRAVIFDFGRVISAQKPQSLFSGYEQELRLTPGTINTIMFESPVWGDALLGRKTAEEYWKAIGPRLGLHSLPQIESFRKRYYADEKINTHVLDLIVGLSGRYKLAVCSNSPPGLAQWLKEWKIYEFFDVVFCSGDEGVAKPDHAAYKATVSRLGVEPFEAVFIDDALENVEAAVACGLRAIHFSDGPALEKALSEILQFTENVRGG